MIQALLDSERSDREVAALRLVGRLGIVSSGELDALVTPARPRLGRRVREYLIRDHQLWRTELPGQCQTATQAARRLGSAYGLTTDGRDALAQFDLEPAEVIPQLVARDRRAPPPADESLRQQLVLSTWAASVLDHLRRIPMLVGVTVQRDLRIPLADQQTLSIPLVLSVTLDPQRRQFARAHWEIPWTDGLPAPAGTTPLRWAVLLDTGRSNPAVLLDQALRMKAVAQAPHLTGGVLRPIVLTAGRAGRVSTIADLWHQAWPETPALLSPLDRVEHPQYGVLWGTYYGMGSIPLQPTTLLSDLKITVDRWPGLTAAWLPT